MGVSFLGGLPKRWLSCWFPFKSKSIKKGVPTLINKHSDVTRESAEFLSAKLAKLCGARKGRSQADRSANQSMLTAVVMSSKFVAPSRVCGVCLNIGVHSVSLESSCTPPILFRHHSLQRMGQNPGKWVVSKENDG